MQPPIVQGLNVSVCVAVCVHYGALQRRKMLETGQTSDMHGEEAPGIVNGAATLGVATLAAGQVRIRESHNFKS